MSAFDDGATDMKDWIDYGIRGSLHYGEPVMAEPYRHLLERRTAKALDVLQQFFEQIGDDCYLAKSFGVDSLVAYHLAARLRPGIRCAWVNQGPLAEWPDCLALKELLVDDGMLLTEIAPDITLYDWYRQHGIDLGANMSSVADRHCNAALLYNPLDRFARENRLCGLIWGLRWRGEGSHRAYVIKGKGEIYTRKADGMTVCSPVGNWSKAEIFAYIDLHQLAYPAMYDTDRTAVRNGPPIGVTAANMGRVIKFRQLFPEMWRVFCLEFPEIQRYG